MINCKFLLFNIFTFVALSLDENYFSNQKSQCTCAVNPNVCNPYCNCDPFCTNEQKSQFSFYLPESYSNHKISCDPKKRISKINLKSIKEEMPNCYSIDEKENGKKIENYNPKDFAIDNFSIAVDSPFNEEKHYNYSNTIYSEGQLIIGNNTGKIQYFYVPIAIGSSASNALIPLRFNMSLPTYSCRVNSRNPIDFISDIGLIRDIMDPSGKNWLAYFGMFATFRSDIRRNRYRVLEIQYYFHINEFDSTISNISMKRTSSKFTIVGAPSEFMYFTSNVYFGHDTLTQQDNKYAPSDMGYYFGTPIMVHEKENDPIFTESRKPLNYNTIDVLFGVNSTIIFPLNTTGLNEETLQDQIFHNYYGIYKSFGYIIDPNGFEYLMKIDENQNIRSEDKSLKYPIANWTFHYKKFNNDSAPIYILQNFYRSLRYPTNVSQCKVAMITIEFYELDKNGNLFVEDEIRFHSNSYSSLFDFLFRDPSESLQTIGLLFCFALIGTIWCWYSCYFYIED